MQRLVRFVLILLCVQLTRYQVLGSRAHHYGVLAAESSLEKENFCIIFFPDISPLPDDEEKAEYHIIEDDNSLDLCAKEQEKDFNAKIILSNLGNCSILEQARVVQKQGGVGAVFVSRDANEDEKDGNHSSGEKINIAVASISQNSVARLREMVKPVSAKLFAPAGFSFDYSLLIIWVVAMFTVCVGSYWSGHIRLKLHSKEINKCTEIVSDNRGTTTSAVKPVKQSYPEESSLNISPYAVAIFVLCMGATLLLLYFFFEYLVYILIGLFVIVSINSVYVCLYPIVMKIFPRCCTLFECQFLDGVKAFDPRHLLLLIVSISTSAVWVATRKERYSWILQDLLGVLFCINMLKNIRMPNLKICTLLLTLLFFYDIFFVFITPFLTAKGGSVMEEVATGGSSEEKLPMMLKVPHFNLNPLAVCYQFSLLGFGDILIPGLLISYCYGFDLITTGRARYFPLVAFMYGVGLILTFVGVNLMGTAQPALLYLVPATLFPPVVLGWLRGELNLLWNGFKCQKIKDTEVTRVPTAAAATDLNDTSNVELASPSQNDPTLCTGVSYSRDNAIEIVNDSVNERKHLLQ